MGKSYYVVKIDAGTNTVTLGHKEEVMHRQLRATKVIWLIREPDSAFRAKVKIWYNDKGAPARVCPKEDSTLVEFDEPISAIIQGRLAVFHIQEGKYNRVVRGGWIDSGAN